MMLPAIMAGIGVLLTIGAWVLVFSPRSPLHRRWCTRCTQPPHPNSVAALRARENADQARYYPTPDQRRQR